MKRDEELTTRHNGCPNRGHCTKDETKCCYLVKGNCYLENTDLRRLI
jgi:hypothetical protein